MHEQTVAACSGVRALTAELALAGRAGDRRLRGRVIAGFERPGSMRLEGVAPFGQPVFILAARNDEAVLWLPRDRRVLRGSRAEDILGALTGVALAPADLQAVLTGCVTPDSRAVAARRHQNGWLSIDLDDHGVLFLEPQGGGWLLRAARRAGWSIEYPVWRGLFPAAVRLVADDPRTGVDLTATIAQLETNVDLDPAAFTVNVPPDALMLTLEELRSEGPLRAP
jgi:hypothetical protein